VACSLVSVQHLENFLPDSADTWMGRCSPLFHRIAQWKANQTASRVKLHIFISAMKIGLTFLFTFLLVPELMSGHSVITALQLRGELHRGLW